MKAIEDEKIPLEVAVLVVSQYPDPDKYVEAHWVDIAGYEKCEIKAYWHRCNQIVNDSK